MLKSDKSKKAPKDEVSGEPGFLEEQDILSGSEVENASHTSSLVELGVEGVEAGVGEVQPVMDAQVDGDASIHPGSGKSVKVATNNQNNVKNKGAIPKIKRNVHTEATARHYKTQPDLTNPELPKVVFGLHSVHSTNVTMTHIKEVGLKDVQNAITISNFINNNVQTQTNYDNHQYAINCDLAGPAGYAPRQGRVHSYFTRTIPIDRPMNAFTIVHSPPVRVGALGTLESTDLIVNGIVAYRKVSDAVMASLQGVTRTTADVVAPHLLSQLDVYDNSAFFVLAYLVAFTRHDYERNGVQPMRPAQGMEDLFTIINIASQEPAEARNQAAQLIQAMEAGRATFDVAKLTNPDINMLRLIARGPNSLRPPINFRRHIASYFTTPAQYMALLVRGEYNIPVFAMPTTAQMFASIVRFATLIGSHDSMVKGFIRASSMINGHCLVDLDVVRQPLPAGDWMSCIFEHTTTAIPQPHFSNPMWDFISQGKTNFDRTAIFKAEFDLLIGMPPMQISDAGALIGAWLSVGTSTLLNYFNITGREMNTIGAANPVHNNAVGILRSLLFQQTNRIPNFIPMALGMIAQTHDVVFSPVVFVGSNWCNDGVGIPADAYLPRAGWQSRYLLTVPYMISPLSVCHGMKTYSHVWGVSEPPVQYSVEDELECSGPQDTWRWLAHRGTVGYAEKCKSAVPFQFEPYGMMVINALRQHWGVVDDWNVNFNQLVPRGGEHEIMAAAVDNLPVADFTLPMNFVTPGSFLSYDWVNTRVVAPYVTRNNMGLQLFDGLQHKISSPSPNAGIILPKSAQQATIISSVEGLRKALGILQVENVDKVITEGN